MEEQDIPHSTCPECQSVLKDPGPDGQCPVCLLRAGLLGKAFDPEETLSFPLIPIGSRVRYLGDYELLEEIGRGGMGVVFRAIQTGLDRPVAVKVLMGGIWASEEARQRFKLEAKAAAAVKHPSIVAIHEVGEHDGQPYFSMDLIEGEDLGRRLFRERPGPEQAAQWMKEIAAAVEEAHRSGIVHRDLKPSNIVLDGDHPLVTDFGLARFEGPGGLPISTLTGQLMGTPGFLAPERLAGEAGDASVDIYALGAMLYALLTGEAPFAGYSMSEALRLASEESPRSPRSLNPSIPTDLEAICLRCLEKDPADRYPSAEAFALDLERFLDGRPVNARPVGPLARTYRKLKKRRKAVAAVTVAAAIFGFMAHQQVEVRRQSEQELLKIAAERIQEDMWMDLRTERSDGHRSAAIEHLQELSSFLAEIPESNRAISNAELSAEAMAVWSTPEVRTSFLQPGQSLGAAFSADGERIGFLNISPQSEPDNEIRGGVLEVREVATGELVERREVEFERRKIGERVFHPSGMPSLAYPAGRVGDSTIVVFEPGCGCLRVRKIRPDQALLAPYLLWKFGPENTLAYLTSDFQLTVVEGDSERSFPFPARPLYFPSPRLLHFYMGGLKSFNLKSFDLEDLIPADHDFLASSQDQSTALVKKGEKVILWNTENRRSWGELEGVTPSAGKFKLSPDGSLLAVKSQTGAIEIHARLSIGKPPTVLEASVTTELEPLPAASFSPDNRFFALTGEKNGKSHVWIWDVLSGERLHVLKRQFDVLWGPKGAALATYGHLDEPHVSEQMINGLRGQVTTDIGLTVWRLERGPANLQITRSKERRLGDFFRVETSPDPVRKIHFVGSGNEGYVAAGTESWSFAHSIGQPMAWTGRSSLPVAGPDEPGLRREWAPDGTGLFVPMGIAAVGESVADLTGQISSLEPEEARPALSFYSLRQDKMIRVAEPRSGMSSIGNPTSGNTIATLYPETYAFSDGGEKLWVAGSWMRPMGRGFEFLEFAYDLWDATTGELLISLSDEQVTHLAASPDGRFMAAGGQSRQADPKLGDDGLAVWSHEGEKILSLPHSTLLNSLTWSADGKILVTGHGDGLIQWTRLGDDMEELGTEEWSSGLGEVRGLAADGAADRLLAVDDQGTLLVWSLETDTPKEIYRFPISEGALESVAFHDPSGLVAMGDQGGRLHLVELGRFDRFLAQHNALHGDL